VGSGFIVTADGYIVTSNHVVKNATEIQVVLNDGKRLPAEVRGRDPQTGLVWLSLVYANTRRSPACANSPKKCSFDLKKRLFFLALAARASKLKNAVSRG
jgi:S1-C subfamily serine protease